MSDLADAIRASSQRLQINPRDLATIISYETAGTFDPWKAGPTTQHGQHRGLIQWGEPQRARYGVYQGMPNHEQLAAVERYLTDAGVKPGMGMMDLYSAVNAGKVGRNNASDANNGGAPGTVADKVNFQMGGHAVKADALLGGTASPAAPTLAANFGPVAAPTASPATPTLAANFGPVAAPTASPVQMPDPAAGVLAQAFEANDQQAVQQKQAEAAAAARKRALFGDVGSMFA